MRPDEQTVADARFTHATTPTARTYTTSERVARRTRDIYGTELHSPRTVSSAPDNDRTGETDRAPRVEGGDSAGCVTEKRAAAVDRHPGPEG